MTLRAVFLDVGETLLDETTLWEGWADWLGIPRFTFAALFGAAIERGEDRLRVFEMLRPGFDLEAERQRRIESADRYGVGPSDLYPDAAPCLRALKDEGYVVGIAGNSTALVEQAVAGMGLSVDVVTSSESLGVEKPSLDFFTRMAELAGVDPREAAYVGDRLDNDVLPAREAGMVGVFIRRGPWGHLQALRPEADMADLRIDSLDELPAALRDRSSS